LVLKKFKCRNMSPKFEANYCRFKQYKLRVTVKIFQKEKFFF
jgi:hypothetical protein